MPSAHFKVNKREADEMIEIVDALDEVLRHHRRVPAILVLSRLLPSLWCTCKTFNTVTEALDTWRALNDEMERCIRDDFGKLHYDMSEDEPR